VLIVDLYCASLQCFLVFTVFIVYLFYFFCVVTTRRWCNLHCVRNVHFLRYIRLLNIFCWNSKIFFTNFVETRAGESEPTGRNRMIWRSHFIFPNHELDHFKKWEWSRGWSRSWHKLVRLQLFLKIL